MDERGGGHGTQVVRSNNTFTGMAAGTTDITIPTSSPGVIPVLGTVKFLA